MSIKQSRSKGNQQTGHSDVCARCGGVINLESSPGTEQTCLICQARLLNEYFRQSRQAKSKRTIGEKAKRI